MTFDLHFYFLAPIPKLKVFVTCISTYRMMRVLMHFSIFGESAVLVPFRDDMLGGNKVGTSATEIYRLEFHVQLRKFLPIVSRRKSLLIIPC